LNNSASATPPTAAAMKPFQRGEQGDAERFRQHRPVADQRPKHEIRARQHVRLDVVDAHHKFPQAQPAREHNDGQQHPADIPEGAHALRCPE
jgi:hypothetical protein